jgi:LysR family glycine cleavage system transcriptional activator
LAPRLGQFQKRHPEIDLRIKTLDPDYGDRNLSGADLEIVILSEDASDPHARKLLAATITPVCSPDLLSRGPRPDEPADVLAFELIHVLGYDDDWHRWFRRHGMQDVAVPRGLSVDGSLIAIEAAQRGDGVMLGRRPFIDSYLRSGELVEAFARPFHLHADYYLRQTPRTKSRRGRDLVSRWLAGLADR